MNKNIGIFDRVIRLTLGAILLVFLFKSFLILVAILLIITALVNFCPIYNILGISSFKVKEQNANVVSSFNEKIPENNQNDENTKKIITPIKEHLIDLEKTNK